MIFCSSSIRSVLFCSRPAVSISSRSAPSALRRHQRLEGEARGVGAGLARDHWDAGALAPDLQLLDRGGAEGVAGRQHHLLALRA